MLERTFWEDKSQKYENKFNNEYKCSIINEKNINKKIFVLVLEGMRILKGLMNYIVTHMSKLMTRN